MSSLPNDVWPLIADYLQSNVLSFVCRCLWHKLQLRHLVLSRGTKTEPGASIGLPPIAWMERYFPQCNTLTINMQKDDCNQPQSTLSSMIAAIYHASSVQKLKMASFSRLPYPTLKQFLDAVLTLHTICSLDFDAHWSEATDDGVKELLRIAQLPRLKHVCLDLSNKHITNVGALALAGLRNAPALQSLSLDLHDNDIGYEGGMALASLVSAPQLRSVQLDLSGNEELTAVCVASIATALLAPRLKSVQLRLSEDQIGAEVFPVLQELQCRPCCAVSVFPSN